MALNLGEEANISCLYGEKLGPDGHPLFQPTGVGMDVMDGRLGIPLDRIALPVPNSPNYDALVSDGKENSLVAITGANGDGIAMVDLTSIPDPSTLSYNTAMLSATRFAGPKAPPATRQNNAPPKAGTLPQPQTGSRPIPCVTSSETSPAAPAISRGSIFQ